MGSSAVFILRFRGVGGKSAVLGQICSLEKAILDSVLVAKCTCNHFAGSDLQGRLSHFPRIDLTFHIN